MLFTTIFACALVAATAMSPMGVTIKGNVIVAADKEFEEGSHLVITVMNNVNVGAPSEVIREKVIDSPVGVLESGTNVKKIPFEIHGLPAGRMRGSGKRIQISAVLNNGWKAEGEDWIHKKDFLSTQEIDVPTFLIELDETAAMEVEVPIEQYV